MTLKPQDFNTLTIFGMTTLQVDLTLWSACAIAATSWARTNVSRTQAEAIPLPRSG